MHFYHLIYEPADYHSKLNTIIKYYLITELKLEFLSIQFYYYKSSCDYKIHSDIQIKFILSSLHHTNYQPKLKKQVLFTLNVICHIVKPKPPNHYSDYTFFLEECHGNITVLVDEYHFNTDYLTDC